MRISYTFFQNYHFAAKEFAEGDMQTYGRLMYLINVYAIEGDLPEDLSPVEKLYITSIKASLDKSIRLSEAGRRGGKNKKHPEEEEDTPENDLTTEALKPFKMACNEKEEEREKELEYDYEYEKETEENRKAEQEEELKRLSKLSSDLTPKQKIVFDWALSHNLSIKKKNKYLVIKIAEYLEENKLDIDFLDYVFSDLLMEYPLKNLGILFNAFSWETTLTGYKTIQNHIKKKEIEKHPVLCTVCGDTLVETVDGIYECLECRENRSPIWWEYNKTLKRWDCSR